MKPFEVPLPELRRRVEASALAAREQFSRTGNGASLIQIRAEEIDALLRDLWTSLLGKRECAVAVFALGGYGRRELFPYSDIDLFFLCTNESAERDAHQIIHTATQCIWDAGLRASPSTRTLRECERLDATVNLEFGISLLDRRFLCGDATLAARFESETLPNIIAREAVSLEALLGESTRTRHARYGNTIFHLEPNLKECPGALRDFHLIRWLQLIRSIATTHAWPTSPVETSSTPMLQSELQSACDFLASARCFLHFRNGRDENTLDWSAQDEAAAASIGLETLGSVDPAYWMRTYYRHARTIFRRAELLLDTLPESGRKPLLKVLRRKRTHIPGTVFTVEDGRISIDETAALTDAEGLLRVFTHMARHGSRLREAAETRITETLTTLAVQLPEGPYLWNALRDILLGPFAAHALRSMHALGLLELILPEFHGIDSLVVRDAYHRYTVDEHTFVVIDNLHSLRTPHQDWEKRFSTLLPEVERRDLLLLAMLLHDTGKARRTGDHARESIELAERVFARLEFDLEERDAVRRLIRNHLEMSLALRRDIFDPETIRAFSEHAPSQQQLKMLTLLTVSDIKAVHPDALTPWKAENIWQLYIATANFLDRSVDETRYHVDADPVLLSRILARVSVHGGIGGGQNEQSQRLRSFLEGMPQRYLQTRLPDQIGEHFLLASLLHEEPVQLALRHHRQGNEITLITRDRPMLFADMAGALSAWGMNIVKADAFSNSEGVILDSFQFTDPFRTLELNPEEHERFLTSMREMLSGTSSVEGMLNARLRPRRGGAPRRRTDVKPRFDFDNNSSSHSTLLQVVAPDSPGLLRGVAVAISATGCNIEVALVDTEGEIAIDVFYLTVRRADGRRVKLMDAQQKPLSEKISAVLERRGIPDPETPVVAEQA